MTKFTPEHEWIAIDGDAVTIGITDHAQRQLGDLIFIELPKLGAQLKVGGIAGTVESGKAVSDIFVPAAGVVTELNPAVVDDPSLVNVDAMANWFFKMRLDPGFDFSNLMDAAQYEEYSKTA